MKRSDILCKFFGLKTSNNTDKLHWYSSYICNAKFLRYYIAII